MDVALKINCREDQIPYLTSVFDDTPISLVKAEDGVYLQSTEIVEEEFDRENSGLISESWDRARQFISRVNGAAMIENKRWTPLSLENMKVASPDEGEKWFPIAGSAHLGSSCRESMSAKSLLKLADRSAHVAKVLRLQCQEMDWANLYRLLEVVREDVGGDEQIDENGWAEEDEIDKFTGSANNSSVTGDDSRHGIIDGSGQPSETMTLRDARSLIKGIILQWLAAKMASV